MGKQRRAADAELATRMRHIGIVAGTSALLIVLGGIAGFGLLIDAVGDRPVAAAAFVALWFLLPAMPVWTMKNGESTQTVPSEAVVVASVIVLGPVPTLILNFLTHIPAMLLSSGKPVAVDADGNRRLDKTKMLANTFLINAASVGLTVVTMVAGASVAGEAGLLAAAAPAALLGAGAAFVVLAVILGYVRTGKVAITRTELRDRIVGEVILGSVPFGVLLALAFDLGAGIGTVAAVCAAITVIVTSVGGARQQRLEQLSALVEMAASGSQLDHSAVVDQINLVGNDMLGADIEVVDQQPRAADVHVQAGPNRWLRVHLKGSSALHEAQHEFLRGLGAIAGQALAVADQHASLTATAMTDELTGIANRRGLEHLIDLLPAEAEPAEKVAVVFIDLDKFKPVNDTYGHAAGDALLIACSDRLGTRLRDHDVLGRVGGDEFVAVLREVHGHDDALMVANRLVSSLKQPFLLDGVDSPVTIGGSAGVAVGTVAEVAANGAAGLIEAADQAMYAVKHNGRGAASIAPSVITGVSTADDDADGHHPLRRARGSA